MPPIWMSTDLRDGNQALIEPMSPEKKLRFFEMLVQIGLKEIEVGFPSASQTDFDFVRKLIDENRIPDDVTIIVLTQSRDELIRRTVESAAGAKRAIVHLYNSVAPVFRRVVFNMSREEIIQIAVTGTALVKELVGAASRRPNGASSIRRSRSPPPNSIFRAISATRQRRVAADAAQQDDLQPAVDGRMQHAERVCRPDRMDVAATSRGAIRSIISVHPHNDRGTAIASAELAVMAGADRVEGCLFGNGERTGNVDLVTLAMNLYTQGVHPGLDFSDIDAVRQVVEECNQLPVHPRHPYAGDLVFTAFSGSHQDAIKKGFAQQKPDAIWEVPYLPIDPADLGRSYDAVIRVNSQSGKGGMAYLLEQEFGLQLPRRLQIEFSRAVQAVADASGREIAARDIHDIFCREYFDQVAPYAYGSHKMVEDSTSDEPVQIDIALTHRQAPMALQGGGNGPIDAFVNALGLDIKLMDYHEHSIGSGANARAACYVELRLANGPTLFGAGIDSNIVTASFKAVLSAVNRQLALAEKCGAADARRSAH